MEGALLIRLHGSLQLIPGIMQIHRNICIFFSFFGGFGYTKTVQLLLVKIKSYTYLYLQILKTSDMNYLSIMRSQKVRNP